MAKQTKAPKAPATPAPATATGNPKNEALAKAREARQSAENKDQFFLGTPIEGAKKLSPQAQVIVNVITAAGEAGLSRTDLVANLKGVLVTRQPEGRILSYYQKSLVESGHIVMTKATPAPAPETEAPAPV